MVTPDAAVELCRSLVLIPCFFGVPACTAGPNASDKAGRGLVIRAVTVLLPDALPEMGALGRAADTTRFAGDGERGGSGSLLGAAFDALGIPLDTRGAKPKPPRDVREGAFTLDGVGFFVNGALPAELAKVPSLVLGLLRSLPFLLRLDAGLGGGPMGLSMGEKKLDLRLSFGVVGIFCRLSIVRSLREGLDFRSRAGPPKSGRSGGSVGDSS